MCYRGRVITTWKPAKVIYRKRVRSSNQYHHDARSAQSNVYNFKAVQRLFIIATKAALWQSPNNHSMPMGMANTNIVWRQKQCRIRK